MSQASSKLYSWSNKTKNVAENYNTSKINIYAYCTRKAPMILGTLAIFCNTSGISFSKCQDYFLYRIVLFSGAVLFFFWCHNFFTFFMPSHFFNFFLVSSFFHIFFIAIFFCFFWQFFLFLALFQAHSFFSFWTPLIFFFPFLDTTFSGTIIKHYFKKY